LPCPGVTCCNTSSYNNSTLAKFFGDLSLAGIRGWVGDGDGEGNSSCVEVVYIADCVSDTESVVLFIDGIRDV